jgi:hypothetical protein
MKRNLKKTLAFVLVLALTLTMFSGTAFADKVSVDFKANDFDDGTVMIECGGQEKELESGKTITFKFTNSEFEAIETYTAIADADRGYVLEEWDVQGNMVSGSGNEEIDRSLASNGKVNRITPIFSDAVKLTVTASPEHGGDIEVKIDGKKTMVKTEKVFSVVEDSKVTIEALREKEDDKYKFISFGGDVYGKDNVIKVTMDEDKQVIANFRPKVKPILEFVVDNGGGDYTAHLGCDLDGVENVIISVGDSNKLYGGGISGQNAGQPITFAPGRHYDSFAVDFDGSDLFWKLDGKTIKVSTDDEEELRFTLRPVMFAYGDIVVENLSSGGDIIFDGQAFEGGAREIYIPCYTDDEPTQLVLTGEPDEGLEFYSWKDNSSTKNPRYITFNPYWFGTKKMVREPHAVFETGEVVLTIVAEEHGTTSISKKVYHAGDMVIVDDIAKYIATYEGYAFDGFDEASENFVIYNSTTLTAKFVAQAGAPATTPVATATPDSSSSSDDVPKTGDESADLSVLWILAMALPLLGLVGYKVIKTNR